MERLMNDSPCQYCNKNRQEDDSYPWIMPCYNCPDRSEWITKQLICLSLITDILGDDYDLSRLRELVQADRDGRCVVLPAKIGDSIYFTFLGKIIEKQVFSVVTFYNSQRIYCNGTSLYFGPDDIGETVFLTREAAEEALEGES